MNHGSCNFGEKGDNYKYCVYFIKKIVVQCIENIENFTIKTNRYLSYQLAQLCGFI